MALSTAAGSTLTLLAWSCCYVASATLEITAVKGLNEWANVWLPTLSALAQNALWLLLLPSWAASARRRPDLRQSQQQPPPQQPPPQPPGASSSRQLPGASSSRPLLRAPDPRALAPRASPPRAPGAPPPPPPLPSLPPSAPPPPPPTRRAVAATYALFTLVTFLITLLRNVGATALPAGVFALLVSSSIVFNIALSRVVLQRRLNRWHVLAAGLCVAAAATLGLASASGDARAGAQGHRYAVGVPAALGAAFCIAASSIISDRVTRDWPARDKEHRILEMTLVASLGASLLLVPSVFLLGEQAAWRSQLGDAWRGASATASSRLLLLGLLAAMPCIKLASRLSKVHVVAASSALAFEFVQAAGALCSAAVNAALFSEGFSAAFLASAALLAAAFGAYARARQLLKAEHAAEHLRGVRHHGGRRRAATDADAAAGDSSSGYRDSEPPVPLRRGSGTGSPLLQARAPAADEARGCVLVTLQLDETAADRAVG